MRKQSKPAKPSKDYPLFASDNGQWTKKVQGRKYYFGSWKDDPKGAQALQEWLERKDGILAGLDRLRVRSLPDELTLAELAKKFLEVKHGELLNGDLADETFADYKRELQLLVDVVGPHGKAAAISQEHFAAYKRHLVGTRKLGPHRLATVIRYLRACFNYAVGQGWIGSIVFGAEFVPPSTDPESIAKRKMRAGQDADDDPIYTPEQIKWLLKRAPKPFKAMILLALNCGMGPSDLAKLRWDQVNFESGLLSARRGKNGIRREAYLWKKTRKALLALRELKHNKAALAKDGERALVFITRKGEAYVRRERVMENGKVKSIKFSNAVSLTFSRFVTEAKEKGIIPKELKLTYYNLRHTYRTHADNCPDTNAVNRTMGHALAGMARRYVRQPVWCCINGPKRRAGIRSPPDVVLRDLLG